MVAIFTYCISFINIVSFTNMLRSIFITLLLLTIYISPVSAFYIEAVDFLFSDSSIVTIMKDNDTSMLYRTSLRSCVDRAVDKINFNSKLSFISKFYPTLIVLADNNSVILYNLIDKKKITTKSLHLKRITSIIQDRSGEYVATSDGRSIVLYKLVNEKLVVQFKKEFVDDIAAYLIDSDSKILYTAVSSGVVSRWNFSARLISVADLKIPIIQLIDDSVFNKIFVLSRQGLYLFSKDLTKSETFLKARIDKVLYDSRSARVVAKIGANYMVYDYTSKKFLYEIDGAGKTLAMVNNANILVAYGQKIVYVYDLRFGINVGSITYTPHGTMFLPPTDRPSLFNRKSIDQIALNEALPMLNDRICTPFAAAIAGAYITKSNSEIVLPKLPREKSIEGLANLTIDEAKSVKIPDATKLPAEPVKPAQVKSANKLKQPLRPTDPNDATNPNVQKPVKPRSKDVTNKARLLADADIPKWIIDRNKLPAFSVVKSGVTDDDARATAEADIKNEIVKTVMKKILDDKNFVSKMADGDVKKRLLWMIASNVTLNQSHKIRVNDSWTSSNGQHYVYMSFNPEGIDAVFDNIYNIEINKVRQLGEEKYMNLAPNKLK